MKLKPQHVFYAFILLFGFLAGLSLNRFRINPTQSNLILLLMCSGLTLLSYTLSQIHFSKQTQKKKGKVKRA